ncbi:MAG: flagellar hook-basal body complex protein FliE [Candidatus Delongbacteria bacterium]|nr:flagellar hook-basal body complex protein FliE [Candidatus Delongbacteria bacterium]
MKIDPAARLLELPQSQQFTLRPTPTTDRPLIDESRQTQESGFGDVLRDFIDQVNQQQIEKDDTTARFLSGEIEDVHTAMVAMEKANISFQFLLEVRNKLMEGYREVMRMQV